MTKQIEAETLRAWLDAQQPVTAKGEIERDEYQRRLEDLRR